MTREGSQQAANGHASGSTNGQASSQTRSDFANHFTAPSNRNNTKELTTNWGAGVPDNTHSLTVGPRGPVLLEDAVLQEKNAQFNRERIPERVVHARGVACKGYFECTKDISHLTKAKLFGEVGKRTDVAVRFSTVVHERGSPESLRDVRGFAVKFYTEEGNWDQVGNDIPVFFIRDGTQFPDLNHSLKPNPVTGVQEGWRPLDFLTQHPEATHILTWLLDYHGIPKNWRKLEGHGVNTYTLINAEGTEHLVKFHWYPEGGSEFLLDDEAKAVGEENWRHSHATKDLIESIQAGNPPVYNWTIQVIPIDKQNDFSFDPLDATKDWPESEVPHIEVGKMVLDKTVGNLHNEGEQIAFSPADFIPGIAASNDKLLQSRLHAYADAQRYRIGVNYALLPINAPRCPYHMNQNEGAMQFQDKTEEVNYWPSNRAEKEGETNSTNPLQYAQEHMEGSKVREDLPRACKDPGYDFLQAGERWRNIIKPDEKRAAQFLKHVVGWMSMPQTEGKIRDTWLGYWSKVDEGLGERVAKELKEALKA